MQRNDKYNYVQVCHDYICKDEENAVKKGEILMLIEKKNEDWWICTKDDGNNNYNRPFFVPSGFLIELSNSVRKNDDADDDTLEYDPESADYVNAVISDLDDVINEHDACEEVDNVVEEYEEDGVNYVNNRLNEDLYLNDTTRPPPNLQPLPTVQPPKIKERKIPNKDYVKEHEEMERLRMQQYLNESKIETPEPDYV